MSETKSDPLKEKYLRKSIAMAHLSMSHGNHPFGAVLVIDDQVVMEAENTVVTSRDITRHAELNLVSRAVQELTVEQLSRAVLYASTEPCLMCSGAIFWSGIKQVVFACSKEALAAHAGPPTGDLRIEGPLLEAEGSAVHEKYW
jgi:tRNA(Arg) A34 adenosine deaminase TadA